MGDNITEIMYQTEIGRIEAIYAEYPVRPIMMTRLAPMRNAPR